MSAISPAATAAAAAVCHITPTVDLLFSRWTTPILWLLHTDGVHRFVELERRLAHITPKTLTERLRQLERDGLVERRYHAEVPPRAEYAITDLGRSLAPRVRGARHLDRRAPGRRRARPGRVYGTAPAVSRPTMLRA